MTTNDSNIDLNDDSSSTASGPIYIRQPGFDYHAHEIVQQQASFSASHMISTSKQNLIANLKSFVINESKSHRQNGGLGSKLDAAKKSKKSSGGDSFSNNIKQINSTSTGSLSINESCSNSQANKKAKKKLCIMLDGGLGLTQSDLNSVLGDISDQPTTQNNNNNNSIHLKPLSNKAKREPLPMRLRALPPSFWQQPNQPNVSPGTMYLPPLFKNENIEASNLVNEVDDSRLFDQQSNGSGNNREVRISPANTDLLFKLFETAEQINREKRQLHSQQMQMKLYRNNQKPMKSVAKGLSSKGGEDPGSAVDAVSEGLFPLLRLDSRTDTTVNFLSFKSESGSSAMLSGLTSNGLSNSSPAISTNSTLAAINSMNMNNSTNSYMFGNNNTNGLPSLQFEQNYAQALSEVVAAL